MIRAAAAFIALATIALAGSPPTVAAQQPGKLPRIGILSQAPEPPPTAPQVEQLVQGLREIGYDHGKMATLEIRYGANNPDRLAEHAAELLRLEVAVICSLADLATIAGKRATTTIPIVAHVGFPVESGFVSSLARPGGNITAVAVLSDVLLIKRLELLKQAVPRGNRFAFLWDAVLNERHLQVAEDGARSLGLQLQIVTVRMPADLPRAFEEMARSRVSGAILPPSPMLVSSRGTIAALSTKHRIPTVSSNREVVEAGGLMSYGPSYGETTRLAAAQIDKILKGARPADLPVQQATKFELVVNLKTAKALGLSLPPSLLVRADRVLE